MTRHWRNWIVAAPGPSLTQDVADRCHGHHVIVVNDAWRLLPFADVLYACDQKWWDNKTPTGFGGERWTSYNKELNHENIECAQRHGARIINGELIDGFSFTPGLIHFGSNSGFQAVNLALVEFGAKHVIMVGFDAQPVDGKTHYFGNHQGPLHDPDPLFFALQLDAFNKAAETLPPHIRIVNATPRSAIKCFPMMSLDDAINDCRDWNGPESHDGTGGHCEAERLQAVRL